MRLSDFLPSRIWKRGPSPIDPDLIPQPVFLPIPDYEVTPSVERHPPLAQMRRPAAPQIEAQRGAGRVTQIKTAFPIGISAEYRWHFKDGATGAWTPAGSAFALWPANAKMLEVRDVDPNEPKVVKAQSRPTATRPGLP